MTDPAFSLTIEVLKVALPAVGVLFTGLVGLLLRRVDRALGENTNITEEVKADTARSGKEQGQWRYATDARLRVLEEKLTHMDRHLEHTRARIERIPTESQVGYRRSPQPPEKK